MSPRVGRSVRMVPAIVTALALLTGCSGTTVEHTTPTRATPAGPAAPVALRTGDRIIATPKGDAWWLSTWGHYVAWAESAKRYDPASQVVVYDLTTRRSRVVARARRGSEIMWVRGGADTAVYLTTRPYQGDDERADWQIIAVDLRSGRSRVVDRADSAASRQLLPSLGVSYPWVGYDKNVVRSFNLRTGERRTLVPDARVGRVQLVGERVFYLKAAGDERADVYSVPVTGGSPTRVSSSGTVGDYTAGASGVAYYQPVHGDATSEWFQPNTGPRRLLHVGEGSNLAVGEGFAAWITLGDQVFLRGLEPGAAAPRQLARHWSAFAKMAAFQDRLVFSELTLDATHSPIGERIHLVQVVP